MKETIFTCSFACLLWTKKKIPFYHSSAYTMLLCCPLPGYLDGISASRSLIRLPNNLLRQADHRIQTGNKHKPQMTWKQLCRLQPQTCRVLNTLLIVFSQEIHTHTKEHAHLIHRPKFRSLFEPHSSIFQTAVLNIFTWLICSENNLTLLLKL